MKNESKRALIGLYGVLFANLLMGFPFLNEPYSTILDIAGIILGLSSFVFMVCEIVRDRKAKKQAKEEAESE